MKRGNLTLKNNIDQKVPVRVIRVKVVGSWAEKGVSVYTIFKYRLKRLEGQPILTANQVGLQSYAWGPREHSDSST